MATEIKTNQDESSSYYEPVNDRSESQNNFQFAAIPKPVKSKGKFRGDEKINNQFNTKNEKYVKPNSTSNAYRVSKSGGSQQIRKITDRFSEEKMNPFMDNPYEPLVDRPIDDANKIKPDFYIDRPPTPEYKPKPKGVDVFTQLNENELFDFDLEAEPILQVLIGKSLENAKMELIEEFEKQIIEKHKAEFKKKRDAELMVTQRMEYAYIRRKEENERRKLQHEINTEKQKQAHKKYLSSLLSKSSLGTLKISCLNQLEDHGFLKKDLYNDIKRMFLPWIHEQINENLQLDTQENSNVTKFLSNMQREMASFHTDFVKKEMEKRRKNHEERVRIQKELEEAKRHRKERRIAKRKMREKTEIFENLKKFIIAYPTHNNDILDAEITDITGDKKKKPIVAIIGGLFGTFYLLMKFFDEEMRILNKEGLTKEIANEFIQNFLNERIKISFELKISSKYQEIIESNLKLMDENLDEFSLIREDLLASLSSQTDIFFNNFSFYVLQSENFFDESILMLLNRAFLELIFKSITYKDPPKKEENPAPVVQSENIEEKKDNEEQNEQINLVENSQPLPEEEKKEEIPNKIYPPRPEPTQIDFDMLKARGKLKFSFGSSENEAEEEVKYNALIRVHIPLNYNAPKEEENKENIENNNNEENNNMEKIEENLNNVKEEPANNVIEESFIEPYDGTSFQKLREEYYENDINDYKCQSFNIWQDARYKILAIDKKSQFILFKALLEFWINFNQELNDLSNETDILSKLRESGENMESTILKKIVIDKDEIPIFDIEV